MLKQGENLNPFKFIAVLHVYFTRATFSLVVNSEATVKAASK